MAMDLELALRAMDDNQQLLEQLAVIFSEDAPCLLTEFQVAVSRQNSKSARMAIHSLKGLAASFYDQQAVDDFAVIEGFCVEENWSMLQDAPSQVVSRVGGIINEMFERGLVPRPAN